MQATACEPGEHLRMTCEHFEQKVRQTRRMIYHLALRRLGNRHDAEDVTQETFLRAWANLATFDAGHSFEAWIYRIATNLCCDYYRRNRRHPELYLDAPPPNEEDPEGLCMELADTSNDPEEVLLAREVDAGLQAVIRSLPATYRQCVELLEREYTYEEIAALMGCPVGTVRSRVYRARVQLRRKISIWQRESLHHLLKPS